ncbi:MAG TPA: BTAD domain-containing putative transcriptional regulator [Terriglobales bacterium]|nr:BTAD domain-containing putative transcriptional regulator [Terriglobales bacterium]
MVIRVYLFGRFEARCDRRQVPGMRARKVQEFLSYLLLSKQRQIQREKLADRLWQHVDSTYAKKYLRQALWQLQRAYEAEVGAADGRLLAVDQDWIGVQGDAPLWVDAREMERAYESAIEAPPGELVPLLRERLRSAVSLYRGELLEGWYYDWCVYHRDTYRSMYLSLLHHLMVDSEATGNSEAGLVYGRKALQEDRASERTHALMMRLHHMAGDRTAALRQFDVCETALRDDLGVVPQDSTRRLYELIRSSGDVGQPTVPETTEAVLIPLFRLRELNRSLSVLQEEVAGQIRALEGL